jgi:hypothetical protein
MLLVHALILWGLVILALAVAFLLARRRRQDDDERPDYRTALGFVASSYGVLLGLLVAFGASHLSDVRQQAQNEADSLLELWAGVQVYPPQVRDPTQHLVLCYMRSIRDDSWPWMERGSALEPPRTLAFGDHLRAVIADLPQDGKRQASAYGSAQSNLSSADNARQQLLFFTQPRVPDVIWAVIYVGAFLLFLLIALTYAGQPKGRVIALGSVVVLLTVVVTVLGMLDQPYGVGVRVGPGSLQHAIELAEAPGGEGAAPPSVLGPCAAPGPKA